MSNVNKTNVHKLVKSTNLSILDILRIFWLEIIINNVY